VKTKSPRVTVLLITYNHAAYVRRAIESVLIQNVLEEYQVIVADDASTDETATILAQIAAENPHIRFRFLGNSKNIGITKNYKRAFAACEGEYVAVLEGDDYWSSPEKLQAQLNFLEMHRECDLCSVNYYVYEENRRQFMPRITPEAGHIIFGARELIADNLVGNFSTCMYRLEALRGIPDAIYAVRSYDWAINICIGTKGLIGFLREPMSVYRIHSRGTWSLLSHIEKLKTQLELIPAYDLVTEHVFQSEFRVLSERLEKVIHESQAHPASDETQMMVIQTLSGPPPYSRILDLVPPIAISLGRQILPPALKRYLAKQVFGG
jgi:glycosyltransferase involved in cell wall biosynthesis